MPHRDPLKRRAHALAIAAAIPRLVRQCPACGRRGTYRVAEVGGRRVSVCFRCRHEFPVPND
jgi:hypothetical protein